MAVSGSRSVILGFVPLAADRRYSGVHGLVVAYYVIMNTGTAVVGDVLPCDTFRPRGGEYLGNYSKGFPQALRVSIAHSSSILTQDGKYHP